MFEKRKNGFLNNKNDIVQPMFLFSSVKIGLFNLDKYVVQYCKIVTIHVGEASS